MNLIELHMLQSFPVNCLNRDNNGSPKNTYFGGVPRARVSSQCWKRAIRLYAKEQCEMFAGNRSKYFVKELEEALIAKGQPEAEASKLAAELMKATKIKIDKDKKVKNLFYFSRGEIQAALKAYFDCENPKKKTDEFIKTLKKVIKDGVDIAFFGRMVADSDLTLEGAAMFSHAISVNRVDNELDFFTAVDDLPQKGDSDKVQTGSAHMGDLEFNTACYYRYVALNLDLLADPEHLGVLTLEERKLAVREFLRACVMAVPAARKNSMLASTLPGFVLGIARKGSPLSLANAFEAPIYGISPLKQSQKVLQDHWADLKKLYGIQTEQETALPDKDLNTLLGDLTAYVK